jgi:WD40 repeat protein
VQEINADEADGNFGARVGEDLKSPRVYDKLIRWQLLRSAYEPMWRYVLVALLSLSLPIVAQANQRAVLSLKVQEKFDLVTPGAAVAVTWSSDGSALAAVSNFGQAFTVWDRTGHLINQFTRHGGGPTLWGSLAFVNGSSELVFPPPADVPDSSSFSIWEIGSGQITRTLDGPQPEKGLLNRAVHFMTSPDEDLLAVSLAEAKLSEKNVVVYDTRSWRVLQSTKVDIGVMSLCVFGRGQLLGLGSLNHERLLVLDTKSGGVVSEIQAYEESKYGSIALNAVAGSSDGELIMVGAGAATLRGPFNRTPEQLAWQKSIEPVRMFRVKDHAQIGSLAVGELPIRQAKWDPKGRFVAFIDGSRGLFLWAPWAHEGYQRIELPSLSLSLAIAPDGSAIAVTTDKGVRVFSVN